MHTFFTPLTIVLASLSMFCVAFVWYSPVLFFKAWLIGEGVTKEQLPKKTTWNIVQMSVYSIIAYGAIASVLAVMFDVLAVTTLNLAITLSLLLGFGFIVTTRFVDMLYTIHGKHYEKRAQIKFLVSSLFYLVSLTVMASVIFVTSFL